jgi:hypothetical protein
MNLVPERREELIAAEERNTKSTKKNTQGANILWD